MSGVYPEASLHTDQLSPPDAAVALRSLARRFGAALAAPDDDGPDDLAHRRPTAGRLSAVEHAVYAAHALEQLTAALRLLLVQDDATVELPALSVAPPVQGGDVAAAQAAAEVGAAGAALAELIEGTPASEWTRSGRVGTLTRSALDVARGAVALAIEHLQQVEPTLRKVAAG